MNGALSVLAVGPLATLQDAGRVGYQRFGLSPCGALDQESFAIANLLLGQQESTPAVEFTLVVGRFHVVEGSLSLAFAGNFALEIDGRPAPSWSAFTLEPGQELKIGAAKSGSRGYLACSGGFVAERWLGSASTDLKAGRGGYQGRCLQVGDRLSAAMAGQQPATPLTLPEQHRLTWSKTVRVVVGPQDDYFAEDVRKLFIRDSYRVSEKMDRMGIRLSGATLPAHKGHNIISDAIAPGSIQVPPQGEPIVLLADRQTTGGYPKIATVISADMPSLAQLRPGDEVTFVPVTVDQARLAATERRQRKSFWPSQLVLSNRTGPIDTSRLLGSNLISGVVSGYEP